MSGDVSTSMHYVGDEQTVCRFDGDKKCDSTAASRPLWLVVARADAASFLLSTGFFEVSAILTLQYVDLDHVMLVDGSAAPSPYS